MAVLEGGVGKSEAKGEQGLDMIVLVSAIADKNAFFIDHAIGAGFEVVTVVNRIVFPAAFEGDGQMPRRIDCAEKNFGESFAALLAGIPNFEIGGDAVEPVGGIDIAAGGDGDDDVFIYRRKFAN